MAHSKESAYNAGAIADMGSIPESRRSPGGGNGNSRKYSCLENPTDIPIFGGIIVHRLAKSRTH